MEIIYVFFDTLTILKKNYEIIFSTYKAFTAYVAAKNPNDAEREFKQWLDSEDYGYLSERTILKIELLADTESKPNSITNPVGLLIGMVKDDE